MEPADYLLCSEHRLRLESRIPGYWGRGRHFRGKPESWKAGGSKGSPWASPGEGKAGLPLLRHSSCRARRGLGFSVKRKADNRSHRHWLTSHVHPVLLLDLKPQFLILKKVLLN